MEGAENFTPLISYILLYCKREWATEFGSRCHCTRAPLPNGLLSPRQQNLPFPSKRFWRPLRPPAVLSPPFPTSAALLLPPPPTYLGLPGGGAPGACDVQFRTFLYQTGAKLTSRGLGTGCPMQPTRPGPLLRKGRPICLPHLGVVGDVLVAPPLAPKAHNVPHHPHREAGHALRRLHLHGFHHG